MLRCVHPVRRGTEAVTVRGLADQLLAGDGEARDVAVLGDLNDEPTAATPRSSSVRPAPRSAPPASTAPTMATRPGCGTSPHTSPKTSDSGVHAGQPELIDHTLVSHALPARVERAFTGAEHPLPPVNAGPAERRDKPVSDHAPVLATLRYP
ncbi:hypothetical protein [Streptomyces sp. NBC_00453]|uniref:hypothetical protein n=1 Tax=Streptomyces sp. NBC_00453 TaxID=2903653 RepID=UPI002E1C0929